MDILNNNIKDIIALLMSFSTIILAVKNYQVNYQTINENNELSPYKWSGRVFSICTLLLIVATGIIIGTLMSYYDVGILLVHSASTLILLVSMIILKKKHNIRMLIFYVYAITYVVILLTVKFSDNRFISTFDNGLGYILGVILLTTTMVISILLVFNFNKFFIRILPYNININFTVFLEENSGLGTRIENVHKIETKGNKKYIYTKGDNYCCKEEHFKGYKWK